MNGTAEEETASPSWPLWLPILFSLQNFLGIPLALVGNSMVIWGSFRYHVFNHSMGEIAVVLVQALAICDLSLVLVKWLTDSVTTILNRWVFGDILCFLSGTFSHFLAILEFSILASISSYKFYTLLSPIRSRNALTITTARVYIACLVACCALFRFSSVFWGMGSIYLPEMLTCEPEDIHTNHPVWITYALVAIFGFLVAPMVITVIANIGIIVIASRYAVTGRPARVAVLTVSCISWLFLLSVSPVVVRIFLVNMGYTVLPDWYLVLQKQMFWLNVTFNPVCYTVTNRHFKEYIMKTFRCLHRGGSGSGVISSRGPTIPSGGIVGSPRMRGFSRLQGSPRLQRFECPKDHDMAK